MDTMAMELRLPWEKLYRLKDMEGEEVLFKVRVACSHWLSTYNMLAKLWGQEEVFFVAWLIYSVEEAASPHQVEQVI